MKTDPQKEGNKGLARVFAFDEETRQAMARAFKSTQNLQAITPQLAKTFLPNFSISEEDRNNLAKAASVFSPVRLNLNLDPEFLESLRLVNQQATGIAEKISQQLTPLQKQFEGIEFEPFPPDWQSRTTQCLEALAANGWFISMIDTPLALLYQSARDFAEGREEEANAEMIAHFRHLEADIEETALAAAPDRKKILKKAFNAHRNGDYELSIPVILAQTEAIGRKIFKASVHDRKHVRKIEATLQDDLGHSIRDSFLSILTSDLPIRKGFNETEQHFAELNRHAIMHGADWNYGTELNAYRALSWMNYILQFHKANSWLLKAVAKNHCSRDAVEEG